MPEDSQKLPVPESAAAPKPLSVLSVIALAVSLLGVALYALMFRQTGFAPIPFFIAAAFASLVLPIAAKKRRVSRGLKGKALELAAIVLAGLDFYFFIFALTSAPILVGCLGWVACAIGYKLICGEKKDA